MPPKFDPPLGFLPDHGLVQQHVIEHRSERVVAVLARHGVPDGVTDGESERAGVIGLVDRRGDDLRAPGLHHHAPVGFLLVRGAHHVDLALESEQGTGEAESASPLPGACLGREPLNAFRLVVERLWHGRVRLVRPCRRN
jgi:hypothetical protein